jgi:hypothetical protein
MSIACLERTRAAAAGVVELHPRDGYRAVYAAVASAAVEADDAKVYSFVARQAQAFDLDAEFEALAAEAQEWASLSFQAGLETWPTE